MRRVECWWNGLEGSGGRWLALLTDGHRWQVAEKRWDGTTDTVDHNEETARAVLADWRTCDRRGKRRQAIQPWQRVS